MKAALKEELKLRGCSSFSLIQAVSTRWNSEYYMMDRLYKSLDAVKMLFSIEKNII